MLIHILQKHIDEGVPGSCVGCAVALAMEDAGLKKAIASRAGLYWTEIQDGNRLLIIQSPPVEVINFILRFDSRQPVTPMSFELPTSGKEEYRNV